MPPLAAEFYAALVRKLKEIGYLVGRCCRRTITTCGNEVDVARQVGGEITPPCDEVSPSQRHRTGSERAAASGVRGAQSLGRAWIVSWKDDQTRIALLELPDHCRRPMELGLIPNARNPARLKQP